MTTDVPGTPAASAGTPRLKPGERRLQILQTIAVMLQDGPAERITTAALARRLDLSEAALYRHFTGKAKMFEGLLEFIEQTLGSLINQVESGPGTAGQRLASMLAVLLAFCEKNPGMTRVLTGEALTNESALLQERVNRLLERLELHLKQALRMAWAEAGTEGDAGALAGVLMATVLGRWLRYSKTDFQRRPSEGLAELQALALLAADGAVRPS